MRIQWQGQTIQEDDNIVFELGEHGLVAYKVSQLRGVSQPFEPLLLLHRCKTGGGDGACNVVLGLDRQHDDMHALNDVLCEFYDPLSDAFRFVERAGKSWIFSIGFQMCWELDQDLGHCQE